MSRRKKWALRALLAFTLLIAAYSGYRYWRYSTAQGRLDAITAQLDKDDPGWRYDEIQAARAKRFPPDDRNITKLAVRIRADTPPEYDALPTDWLPEKEFNRLPRPEQLAEARRARTQCKAVIDRALALGQLTDGGAMPPPAPNPLLVSLDHTQQLRPTAGLLRLNAVVLAADKADDETIPNCRTILRLTHGVNDEPTVIAGLIRLAMGDIAVETTERVLGYAEPKAGLGELQAELLAEANEPYLATAFRGERAHYHALLAHLRASPSPLRPAGSDGLSGSLYLFVAFNLLAEDHAIGLDLVTRYLELARGPSHEWLAKYKATPPPGREAYAVHMTLLPVSDKVIEGALRTMARLRCLAAGIACERFRQANGRWPKDLAEIPKTILAAVPPDPYTGEALKYRALADVVVVYAVGEDRTDDGGNRLATRNPDPGEDVGVRLWSPEFRRAAPLPEPKDDTP